MRKQTTLAVAVVLALALTLPTSGSSPILRGYPVWVSTTAPDHLPTLPPSFVHIDATNITRSLVLAHPAPPPPYPALISIATAACSDDPASLPASAWAASTLISATDLTSALPTHAILLAALPSLPTSGSVAPLCVWTAPFGGTVAPPNNAPRTMLPLPDPFYASGFTLSSPTAATIVANALLPPLSGSRFHVELSLGSHTDGVSGGGGVSLTTCPGSMDVANSGACAAVVVAPTLWGTWCFNVSTGASPGFTGGSGCGPPAVYGSSSSVAVTILLRTAETAVLVDGVPCDSNGVVGASVQGVAADLVLGAAFTDRPTDAPIVVDYAVGHLEPPYLPVFSGMSDPVFQVPIDTTGTLVSLVPAAAAAAVPVSATVAATFSTPVSNPSTAALSLFHSASGASVPLTTHVDPTQPSVLFGIPDAALAYNTSYTVVLALENVTTVHGAPLVSTGTPAHSFVTQLEPLASPPPPPSPAPLPLSSSSSGASSSGGSTNPPPPPSSSSSSSNTTDAGSLVSSGPSPSPSSLVSMGSLSAAALFGIVFGLILLSVAGVLLVRRLTRKRVAPTPFEHLNRHLDPSNAIPLDATAIDLANQAVPKHSSLLHDI